VHEKCEAKFLIRMFTDRGLHCGEKKTLIGENDSSCQLRTTELTHGSAFVVDRTLPAVPA